MFIQLVRGYCSSSKPFKFFNYWIKHLAFFTTVKDSWLEPMFGSFMVILHRKLKRLKQSLKAFNKVHFFDISMKVKAKRVEFAGTQEVILSNPRAHLVQLEKNLSIELYELMLAEESFYKQKSRIQWLREGYSNTSFFHKSVVARQSRNTISTLLNANGNRISFFSKLVEEVVSFFRN